MNNSPIYYDLTNRSAQIENFLYTPVGFGKEFFEIGRERRTDPIVIRIGYVVTGIFMCLLSLPLYGMGKAINLIYRQKIDPVVFEEEWKEWEARFEHSISDSSCKKTLLNEMSKRLINQLIRSGKKAKDCAFDHILCVPFNSTTTNVLAGDGYCPEFKMRFRAQKKCLIIGSPAFLAVADRLNKTMKYQLFDETCHFQDNTSVKFSEFNYLYPSDPLSTGFKKLIFGSVRDKSEAKLFEAVTCLWIRPLKSKILPEVLTKIFPPA